jgi:Mrp family chromosome partitioning ATPase
LAKSRLRVLVVDADPYRSQVRSSFGASTFPALAPSVGQSAQLVDIVQTDTKSAAHFIPAPTEEDFQLIIHSGAFAALLDEARKAYDIVIIDTPPVMTSADAAIIGKFADTRLLLLRWGRTSWDEMTATVGFLRLCHVGLNGIVIAGAETGSATYGQLATYDTAPSENRLIRPPLHHSLSDLG